MSSTDYFWPLFLPKSAKRPNKIKKSPWKNYFDIENSRNSTSKKFIFILSRGCPSMLSHSKEARMYAVFPILLRWPVPQRPHPPLQLRTSPRRPAQWGQVRAVAPFPVRKFRQIDSCYISRKLSKTFRLSRRLKISL